MALVNFMQDPLLPFHVITIFLPLLMAFVCHIVYLRIDCVKLARENLLRNA